MKKSLIVLSLLLSLTACNTMSGLGQDIRNMGNSLEKAATNSKVQANSNRTPSPSATSSRVQSYPVEPVEHKELESIPYDQYK